MSPHPRILEDLPPLLGGRRASDFVKCLAPECPVFEKYDEGYPVPPHCHPIFEDS